jgi:GTP-binding protein EngB required for normal cell division
MQMTTAKKLFSKQVSFIKSISQMDQAPDLQGRPEVAFVGRSNVGVMT